MYIIIIINLAEIVIPDQSLLWTSILRPDT